MPRHYRGSEDTEETQQIYRVTDDDAPLSPRLPAHSKDLPVPVQGSSNQRLQWQLDELKRRVNEIGLDVGDQATTISALNTQISHLQRNLNYTYLAFGFLATLLIVLLIW